MPVVIDEVAAEIRPEPQPAPAEPGKGGEEPDRLALLRQLRREAWRRARREVS